MQIYFYGCISMDGYLADPRHSLEWLYEQGTPDETDFDDFYKTISMVLMGRKTFDETAELQIRA